MRMHLFAGVAAYPLPRRKRAIRHAVKCLAWWEELQADDPACSKVNNPCRPRTGPAKSLMAESGNAKDGTAARGGLAAYVRRNSECAFGNLKLLSRVMGKVYDDELRSCGLRASQLSLLWAIAASAPVELGRLGFATLTDQTTLSRTIATLKRARLVSVRTGADRRTKIVTLTPAGTARFAAAMPLWENAQQRASEMVPVGKVRELARQLRKAARRTL